MLKHPEKISYDQLKTNISNLPPSEQALPALAYGTGARVSELIQIKKKDLHIDEKAKYLWIFCRVLKKRSKVIIERKALIRMDEDWLVSPILKHANLLLNGEDFLFPYSRQTIFKKLKKSVIINGESINPHGFRKLRATHLRFKFGFDAYQLQQFFDWKTIEPSGYYVRLDPKEIEY